MKAHWIPVLGCLISGCGEPAQTEPAQPQTKKQDVVATPTDEEREAERASHRIVFADRTNQSYLLLTPGPLKPKPLLREDLVKLVERSFPEDRESEEVQKLIQLIQTEGDAPLVPTAPDDPGSLQPIADPGQDLLGMHFDILEVDDDVLPAAAREDDILLRELNPKERAGLEGRKWALLLRAEYRNRHGVRGLRLLQTLVRLVAREHSALIHDPDTLETLGPEAFARRRLQSSLGNVADQVAVVPFDDPRQDGHLRLTTRGMRRFGSVDLELGGLPRDEWALQRGTDLLYGLALVMVKQGEFDQSGFAVELGESVDVHWRDASQAYAGREGKLPRCDACPEHVQVHLVERERESQDTHGHVVARIVAPRTKSDAPAYDHPAWVDRSLRDLFGDPATK